MCLAWCSIQPATQLTAYIRPRTPHVNGTVERSHPVDDQEFYRLLVKDGITDDIYLFNEKVRELGELPELPPARGRSTVRDDTNG